MIWLGQTCLLVAFVATGYGAVACWCGACDDRPRLHRSGNIAGIGGMVAISLVLACLVWGLVTRDFRLTYVSHYTNRALPWHYAVASLWVGQAGSLLLWSWMLLLLSTVYRFWPRRNRLVIRAPAYGVALAIAWLLIAIQVFVADPLAVELSVRADGAGLSPALQHPTMLIHPPVVLLGYALWSIPFAIAFTALATNRLDASWMDEVRPWSLLAWITLGGGIILGANWAYQELGWGGYWSWDPVENGSFLPWLLGTAAIHTMMACRHRGVMKKSALALTVATFGMCLFATFLTRSGIFSSLHAFSKSSLGWIFLAVMLLIGVSTCLLLVARRSSLLPDNSVTKYWNSREAIIAVTTISITLLALGIIGGTLSSTLSKLVFDRTIVVGVEYYNCLLIPVSLLVLLATISAPVLHWGRSPTQRELVILMGALGASTAIVAILSRTHNGHLLVRVVGGLLITGVIVLFAAGLSNQVRSTTGNFVARLSRYVSHPRQYGGYVVHMGLLCLAFGIAASSLDSQQHQLVLHKGDQASWNGLTFELLDVVESDAGDRLIVNAPLRVTNSQAIAFSLNPSQHFHYLQREWTSEVSLHSTWWGDHYSILLGNEPNNGVRIGLIYNPCVRFIWVGAALMACGGAMSAYPVRRASRTTKAIAAAPHLPVWTNPPHFDLADRRGNLTSENGAVTARRVTPTPRAK